MKQQELKKKLPKLSKKQLNFVEHYVATGNGQESALKSYNLGSLGGKDKENVARSIASENLTKPNVMLAVEIKRETLKSALEKQGITPTKIAEKIDTLLTAVDKDGIEDYNAIDKGLKHATSIYGVVDPSENKQEGNTYNFIFSPEVQSEVKEIENRIKARLIQKHANNQEN